MSFVNRVIRHTLANQVAADGKALQVVLVEDIPATLDIAILLQGFVHLKVVSPASQFQAIEAPFTDLLGKVFQGKISPLAGE
jgi:hypothetical protein